MREESLWVLGVGAEPWGGEAGVLRGQALSEGCCR